MVPTSDTGCERWTKKCDKLFEEIVRTVGEEKEEKIGAAGSV